VLVAVANGVVMGEVLDYGTGRDYGFRYADAWRFAAGAFPLSLSMPLARAEAPPGVTLPYLWGLLPDNDRVLRRWAQRFGVSATHPVGLLAAVGEDCAGAVQFAPPERAAALLGSSGPVAVAEAAAHGDVDWLTEAQLAVRLRDLNGDPAAGREPGDAGQFSLAGAQPKTALLEWEGRWGVPSGRVPTTVILKPPALERELQVEGLAENEHCCLALARALGLPAAQSSVVRWEDQVAIAVARYDRATPAPGYLVRVHQEDACQALGVHPAQKYEKDGGPGVADCVGLLLARSNRPERDARRFLEAVAFNWLIAGTDAHAKNYGLLLGAGGAVRLAPLYDLLSAAPYPMRLPIQKITLAMRVGREYGVRRVGAPHWTTLAGTLVAAHGPRALGGWDVPGLLDALLAQAEATPDHARDVAQRAAADGLAAVVVTRWADAVAERAAYCARQLRLGGVGDTSDVEAVDDVRTGAGVTPPDT
jgi:serine/threonine-protein kinase HipA